MGLGSNQKNRQAQINRALELLGQHSGIEILCRSKVYESKPRGVLHQPLFLNAVVQITTDLKPRRLLSVLQSIEKRMGRQRSFRWGPRCIDLDVLLYDDLLIDEPDLVIPHPEMVNRAFVLVPLMEIAPRVVHPGLGKTMAELLAALGDEGAVWRYHTGENSRRD